MRLPTRDVVKRSTSIVEKGTDRPVTIPPQPPTTTSNQPTAGRRTGEGPLPSTRASKQPRQASLTRRHGARQRRRRRRQGEQTDQEEAASKRRVGRRLGQCGRPAQGQRCGPRAQVRRWSGQGHNSNRGGCDSKARPAENGKVCVQCRVRKVKWCVGCWVWASGWYRTHRAFSGAHRGT